MAQARRNRKNQTPAWVWLVIGILLGFFFSHVNLFEAYRFLENSLEKSQKGKKNNALGRVQKEETQFDFYHILSGKPVDSGAQKHLEVAKQQEKKVPDVGAPKQTHLSSAQKRQITQLPPLSKQKNATKALKREKLSQAVKPQSETPKPEMVREKKNTSSGNFTLQIAALRTYAEADRYKAQLLLSGFHAVKIQKITKGQDIWFRVMVGNYNSRQAADAAKKKLKQHNFNGIVMPASH